MEVSPERIRELREQSDAGLQECMAALQQTQGDVAQAAALLQQHRTDNETSAAMQALSCVSLRLSIVCPTCNSLIAVNGAYQSVQCPDCGCKKNLKDSYGWHRLLDLGVKDVFRWAVKNTNRKTETGSIYTIKLEVGREWPHCFSCMTPFRQEVVKRVAVEGTTLHCRQCDRQIPVLPAPRHLVKPFRCARYVIAGADWREDLSVKPDSDRPLRALHCAACGAPLPGTISGGRVACEFCKTENMLTDYLEFRKKYFARAARWYILFDPTLVRT